jgi:hypothetical protein
VLVPWTIAALFWATGHPLRATILAGFGVVAALLVLAGVPVASWIERGAVKLGHLLAVVAGGGIFLAFIGPAWAWTRIARRDPFGRRAGAPGWAAHPTVQGGSTSLGGATPFTFAGRRSLLSRLTWSVGCLVVLLGLNYGAGWAYDALTDEPTTAPTLGVDAVASAGSSTDGSTTTTYPAPPRSESRYDPRAELPAMAAYPWRYDYFADLQRAPSIYWPYTQYRPMPFTSPYLNIEGWRRRSYRTPGSGAERPTVWMLGGSTTWGEGQRDDYTIASWLARIAEDEGIPLEISNLGQRGWTHFQEMVLFEQQLALEGPPDVAVFYDGVNEVNTQTMVPEAVPSHYDVDDQSDAQDGMVFATRVIDPGTTEPLPSLLAEAYAEHSLVHKVLRYFSSPADAQEEDSEPSAGGDGTEEEIRGESFQSTMQDGIDAGEVYERGKQLTLALSERYDVPTLLYWQPFQFLGPVEAAATEQVEPPTIDISRLLLDQQEVYIDGAHTNEEGARIVAERLWQDLEPEIRAWYAANG